jgi:hypothetical protein
MKCEGHSISGGPIRHFTESMTKLDRPPTNIAFDSVMSLTSFKVLWYERRPMQGHLSKNPDVCTGFFQLVSEAKLGQISDSKRFNQALII